jgi:hypothetical protein
MPIEGMTPRLSAKVSHEFPVNHDVVAFALLNAESGDQDRERVLTAILVRSQGELRRLYEAIHLSTVDWRDVLVGTGLENADWPDRLNDILGEH